MDQPLLSVIIPVYKVEEYIEKCLYSLRTQSYRAIEIICVDDASPDGSAEIVKNMAKQDERIRLVRHEKNRGLFQARLTGLKQARGKYIAFVDSDDFVSCDWFRPLIDTATREQADMVLGNTVNVNEKGERTYYNHYRSFNTNRSPLEGAEVLKALFAQRGECFVWHTVWNKVYTKALFERAMPSLEMMPEPLIMGEDIAFSTVLYSLANKLAFCDNDCYFYYRHAKASTGVYHSKDRYVGYVRDITQVFAFVETYLRDKGYMEAVKDDFRAFREKYFRIWSGNTIAAGYDKDKQIVAMLLRGFQKDRLAAVRPGEFYFYEQSTAWDEKFEELRYKIQQPEITAVSFDVFDTLLVRPFWEPADLLYYVGRQIRSIIAEPATFVAMRLEAEEMARLTASALDKHAEDIELADIYGVMGKSYGFSAEQTQRMLREEERAEELFCRPRKSGKILFELAKHIGKRIYLTSDMYLSERTVERILRRCGYGGYEALFVSSAQKRRKGTGKLYRRLLECAGCPANELLHIGDNWSADVIAAQREGIQTLFLPKGVETYTNNISNIFTGDAFKEIYLGVHSNLDSRVVIEQFPLRSLYACVANGAFDNPFRSFNRASYYNADAYYIGFTTMGMHMLGMALRLHEKVLEIGYDHIVFLARDGYLIKQVYDTLFERDSIQTSYFYASRRALLPYSIECKEDIYHIFQYIDLTKTAPADVLEFLEPISKRLTMEQAIQYQKRGVELKETFKSKGNYLRFATAYLDISFDEQALNGLKPIRAAFSEHFSGKCVCFDIGYSGRLQKIISRATGRPIDVFYLHSDGSAALDAAEAAGFRIHNFYEYTPNITAVLREYLISEAENICVGYRLKGGRLQFVFDKSNVDAYGETYAVRELQRGALDFCRYCKACLGAWVCQFKVRPQDISIAFENFLINATEFDRKAFSNSYIEDAVYGGYTRKNFYEIWNWHLNGINKEQSVQSSEKKSRERMIQRDEYAFLSGRSKWMKGLFYWLFDRRQFHEKMRQRKKIRRYKKEAAKT